MTPRLIPERLKKVREKEGITMAEASRSLNLSKIGYCRYEYGERAPSMQTVEVIAQCFHTSVEYLVGLSDSPDPIQVVINKNDNPALFELVEFCEGQNSDQINRLLAYYKKMM